MSAKKLRITYGKQFVKRLTSVHIGTRRKLSLTVVRFNNKRSTRRRIIKKKKNCASNFGDTRKKRPGQRRSPYLIRKHTANSRNRIIRLPFVYANISGRSVTATRAAREHGNVSDCTAREWIPVVWPNHTFYVPCTSPTTLSASTHHAYSLRTDEHRWYIKHFT